MATAFAVFCATDGSLTFYNRDSVPSVGDMFEGKVASNVYTGFVSQNYSDESYVPWYNERADIHTIFFTDEFATVKPISTAYWFYEVLWVEIFDAKNLDTSRVTNMQGMFYDFGANLNILDLHKFNTSKVTNMQNMFSECGVEELNISNFNTSNVTNMNNMFSGCDSLRELDLSSFDTSSVTHMNGMFRSCPLYTLDLSSFDTSKVTDMQNMFNSCGRPTTIYVSELWSIDSVVYGSAMFSGCENLVGAIPYDSSKLSQAYANYENGYFTYKRHIKQEDMIIKNTTLYSLADKIRNLNNNQKTMTPSQMIDFIPDVDGNLLYAEEVEF